MAETLEFVIKLRGGAEAAADAKKVEAAVSGVGGKMRTVGSESERASKHTSAFGSSLKHLAVGLGAVGAGYAAYSAAKGAITYTDELGKSTRTFSKATSLGVAESSRLVGVAGALGIESSKLGMVFTKLGKATIAQATATGKHVTAFDRLGISQAEAKAHLNDTAGILDLVTKKLATEHIPAAEKSAVMTELFGRAWRSLGPLLLEGEVGLKGYLKTAKEYGLEIGGNSTEALKKFHDQQVESTIAGDALRISFTKLVAGPLGGMLGGFAKLVKYGKEGNWTAFNKEVDKIGKNFATLAEKVLPKVAGGFARIAPAVLKAFWKGFVNAPIGAQAVLVLALATKFGLTGAIFKGIGTSLGKSIAGGLLGQETAAATSGTALGTFFGKAFALAAAGYLIYENILKGSPTEPEPLGELFDPITGDKNKREKAEARQQSKEQHAFLKRQHHAEHVAQKQNHSKAFGNIKDPTLRHRAERYAREHHLPGAALGGTASSAGLALVGEHGPEIVHLPQSAVVDPLKPGSLADNRPIILKVDGKVLARVNRRELLQTQAAGA